MKPSDQIDACKYLYLRELNEPDDNCLRIIIEEAKSECVPEDLKVGESIIRDVREIESDATCHVFELMWPTYVAYSVRNESFVSNDEAEKWEGKLFGLYSKSHFLDYAKKGTFAGEEYPGPLKHWGIKCLNHIIDIISHVEPKVKLLSR